MDAKALSALLLAIECGSVIAYIVYGIAIKNLGASKASMFACAEIPAATILSVLFLGNVFSWFDIVGFLLIASTVIVLADK